MTRQDFQYTENAGKRGGVKGIMNQMWKKQHGKFIDEVNKPQSSTEINTNGLI